MRTAIALVLGLALPAGPAFAEDVAITSGPVGTITTDTATFTFTPGQAECSLDAGAFVPCTSPFTVGGLRNGVHTLTVRAGTEATTTWSVLVPQVLPIMIPARVIGVNVEREARDALITWKPVYGATAYQVKIGAKTHTVHRTQLRLGGLKPGRKYRVTIVATNRYGSSPMKPFTVRKYHKH